MASAWYVYSDPPYSDPDKKINGDNLEIIFHISAQKAILPHMFHCEIRENISETYLYPTKYPKVLKYWDT